ncbi:MAG: hypothetical protein ACYC8W_00600 [Candidatus Tyrphobacter sp.]
MSKGIAKGFDDYAERFPDDVQRLFAEAATDDFCATNPVMLLPGSDGRSCRRRADSRCSRVARKATRAMFPVLVFMCARLAIGEERQMRVEFGSRYDEYAAVALAFIPRFVASSAHAQG